jgi:hypothetical protein
VNAASQPVAVALIEAKAERFLRQTKERFFAA